LFVERFIFKKRDARIAIAKFRDELATVGDRGLVLADAIDLSNELLSSRVQAIRFDDEGAISDLKADFRIPVPGNGNRLALTITFPEHRGFLLTGEASALSDIAQHVGRRLTELDREEERMQTILQESRLTQSVVESELRALRAQVNPALLLAGWVHYLAFDLFVGCWEVRDARELGISYYLVVPCLICTFLFGPAGWLIYFLLRTIARRAIDPVSCPATPSLALTKTLSADVPDMLVDWNLRRVVMSLWVRMPRDAPNVANPGLSQAVTIPYD
jgi:hypothetical protein